ncbi:MAG: hypothetical protein MJY92_03235 [Bacteroidales bacterium]|nr:hypothetical protein [Bacteroidales bacterium]
MRRIVYTLLLLAAIACGRKADPDPKPIPKPLSAPERVDSLILDTVGKLNLQDSMSVCDMIRTMISSLDIDYRKGMVEACYIVDKEELASLMIDVGFRGIFVKSLTIARRLEFVPVDAMTLGQLAEYVMMFSREVPDNVEEIVDEFNSDHRVDFLLDGEKLGKMTLDYFIDAEKTRILIILEYLNGEKYSY